MSSMRGNAESAKEVEKLVGKTVGKYEILGVLGRGGMGCVYEAVHTAIAKRVAMKCIDHELAANPEANARFQREAMAASAIESPHIVQIFDAGTMDDGTPFIVMELLRGQDLGMVLAEHDRLDVDQTLQLIAQILKALSHAHDAGIVHRDLKPDNVFLVQRDDDPWFVKLLDFGVSKIARSEKDVPLETLTRQGTVVGTPYYMSPEQAQAYGDLDGQTDIYSVGAILYECLTGRPPHSGRSYEQVIVNICMNDADDVREHVPAVSAPVAALVSKALARERADRFASAREMLEALIEAAPSSLRVSSPSAGAIRLPAEAATTRPEGTRRGAVSYPTERQIIAAPSSVTPSELARTVQASDEDGEPAPDTLVDPPDRQSGITEKVPSEAVTTVRSPPPLEAIAGVPRRSRWTFVLAPGLALAVGAVIYLGAFQTPDEGSGPLEPEVAAANDDPEPARTTEAAPGSPNEGRQEDATSEGSASAAPSAPPEAPPSAPPRRPAPKPSTAPAWRPPPPPSPAPPKPVPPPPSDQAPPPEPPTLELQEG